MLQAIWTSIRRRRTTILLVLSAFVSLLYLSRSSGQQHLTLNTAHDGPHRALLVTTPGDEERPLHLLPLDRDGEASIRLGKAVPIITGINPGSKQGVSHLVRHPSRDDVVYVNNEVRPGSVWTGGLGREKGGMKLGIFGQNPSFGDLPAHSLVSRDGQHLIVANYGTPTIALYTIGTDGQIRHAQTVKLPRPSSINADTLPHPHQIAQHPNQPVYYVPDLGLNVVFVLRMRRSRGPVELEVVQTFDTSAYGQGPRNGVVSTDGRTFYLSFQTSSTLIAISQDRQGHLHSAPSGAITTLPSQVLEEGLTTSSGEVLHSSSDILLFDDNLVLVANRRVKGPYPSYTGTAEDSIAVFEASGARLQPRGHIHTGCWKPREMMRVKTDSKDYLAVTCNGQFAQGGGVILVNMSEPYSVVDRWDSGRISVSGMVGLTTDHTTA